MPDLVTTTRFPEIAVDRGHYESFFAKLCHPSEPIGAWIRYTVHKRPGALARGSLWFTLFEQGAAPYAVKQTHEAFRTTAGRARHIEIGESLFEPGRMTGTAAGEGREAAWDLRLAGAEPPYRHLPRAWMYSAPVPRTKLLSPYPAVRFAGSLRAGERTVEVEGWNGSVGHNWGAQHAERWIWLHGTGFAGHDPETTWFDAALGRIRVGPRTLPWIANGRLALDGETYTVGGPGRVRQTHVSESPTRCAFELGGKGCSLAGSAEATADQFVGWVYADPDGSQHHAVNCSIAQLELELRRPGQSPVKLMTDHQGTYELGMRETDHGIAIQPFSDG